jgi:hypothetical protein
MKKITKKELLKRERKAIKYAFAAWSLAVKARDKSCIVCGIKSGEIYTNKSGKRIKARLNAHHIFPREIKDLRFNLDNGISLCSNHHEFSRECSPHSNGFAFSLFLLENRPEQVLRLLDLCESVPACVVLQPYLPMRQFLLQRLREKSS